MNPSKRITPVGGNKLSDLTIAQKIGVQVKRSFEVKYIDSDFFDEN